MDGTLVNVKVADFIYLMTSILTILIIEKFKFYSYMHCILLWFVQCSGVICYGCGAVSNRFGLLAPCYFMQW